MRYVLTDEQNFIDIANSIRLLADFDETMYPSQMATIISDLSTAIDQAIQAQQQATQSLEQNIEFLEQVIGGYTEEFDYGGSALTTKPIKFYSPYGDLVISYTHEEVQLLTSLPPAPSLNNLIFETWNYSLSQIKAAKGNLDIGAIYTTADASTQFDIFLTVPTGKTITINNIQGITSVDFGDGTILEGTPFTHTYEHYGNYTISIYGDLTLSKNIFNEGTNYIVTAIRLPQGTTFTDAFENYYSLRTITLPNEMLALSNNAFTGCKSLKSIIIPSTAAILGIGAFKGCNSLTTISIPQTPQEIPISFLEGCVNIDSITIPSSITKINKLAFSGCDSISTFDLSNLGAVPTLSNIDAFSGINSICTIKVSPTLRTNYAAATNWETYKNYMIYEEEDNG